ncbi:MAG: winged helix-turn-helix domain-containing protein [Acidobacteriota bacterium]|nr:winged helix-turn-helix domain-containing protein [Acidobacteriota bacterium]
MKRQALYQFGEYTLNPSAMSLRRGEELVRLAPKVFDTLSVLVERRGEVVTKQQLMDAVWPGTFVEESNLAQNVFLLRKNLGQTAEGVEYIETLSKRGYRMNVPVHEVAAATEESHASVGAGAGESTSNTGITRQSYRGVLTAAAMLAVIVLLVLFARWYQPSSASVPIARNFVQITHDTKDKRGRTGALGGPDAAFLTDGNRLYFTSGTSTAPEIWQVSTRGGEPAPIPVPFAFPQLLDYSVARSELLFAGSMDDVTSRPLWSAPMPAGVPHRLGKLTARDGAWSPDGHEIAFTNGTALYLANELGSEVRKLADLPGIGWRPRWSPDGKLLRLTIANIANNTQYLWEVASDGRHARRLLEGWNKPSFECCGVWNSDGNRFVFQATRDGRTDVWSLDESRSQGFFKRAASLPTQISHGQINSLAPVFSPDGRKLFVIGQQLRGELQRFDSNSGEFVPYLNGMSADFVEFSRDGQWLLYVAFPEATLWRSKADGSERVQLTFAPLQVMIPHWSPDGKFILFHGLGGGRDEVYIIPAEGGEPWPVAKNSGRQMMNETWSPDGNSIAYSDYPFFGEDPSKVKLHVLDLRTKRITDIPRSEGYFAPAWSPNGRYLAASSVRGSRILLFDFQTQQWFDVAEGWDLKKWSRDSQYLFFMRHGDDPAIMKLRATDRKPEKAASLKGFDQTGRLPGLEFSLDLNGAPMLLKDTGTQEIYSINWDER